MALRPVRTNDGPVFRTLREIHELPPEQRLDACIDRLDLLDEDERNKVAMDSNGNEYSVCSNTVRLKIFAVGREWIEEAGKDTAGTGKGKFAALHRFNEAPKKAAG